jgi:hypothetical protein
VVFLRTEKVYFIIGLFIFGFNLSSYAQTPPGSAITKNGLEYVITTAVPFLRIGADARASGMAEVGVSTSADNNSGFHNPAKLAFVENDMGGSINFAPWLRQITNDIYLINGNLYYKPSANHTMGIGIRYFTLGEINYRDAQNGPLGISKPYEGTFEGHYAFRLSEFLSIGASGRFILSDLSNGATNATVTIPVGTAFSVDFAAFYSKKFDIRGMEEAKINIGANISNVGTKIQYSTSEPDYIPTNLAIGATFEGKLDEFNSFSGTLQFDKLLVPSPTYKLNNQNKLEFVDANRNGTPDFKEHNSISGIITSFGDNGDGLSGELKEYIVHLGAEYAYQKTYFARTGFFYEPDAAGGRQYVTAGIGLKYNAMKLDFSYLLPITQQKSPLDNQMRVSVSFNVGEEKSKNSNYW